MRRGETTAASSTATRDDDDAPRPPTKAFEAGIERSEEVSVRIRSFIFSGVLRTLRFFVRLGLTQNECTAIYSNGIGDILNGERNIHPLHYTLLSYSDPSIVRYPRCVERLCHRFEDVTPHRIVKCLFVPSRLFLLCDLGGRGDDVFLRLRERASEREGLFLDITHPATLRVQHVNASIGPLSVVDVFCGALHLTRLLSVFFGYFHDDVCVVVSLVLSLRCMLWYNTLLTTLPPRTIHTCSSG